MTFHFRSIRWLLPVLLWMLIVILGVAYLYFYNRPTRWPFDGFTEIRAYTVNFEDEYNRKGILLNEGELNPTRYPLEGVRLTERQMVKLRDATCQKHFSHPPYMCFNPHHAFVFFSPEGKVVGHMDICFHCSNYGASPKGFEYKWDLGAISGLFQELGLPLQNPKWDEEE